jgi:hypothetical protein
MSFGDFHGGLTPPARFPELEHHMDDSLTWLLTSTTYGTWLPGDERGFVGRVRDVRVGDEISDARIEHDRVGTQYDAAIPKLREASIAS